MISSRVLHPQPQWTCVMSNKQVLFSATEVWSRSLRWHNPSYLTNTLPFIYSPFMEPNLALLPFYVVGGTVMNWLPFFSHFRGDYLTPSGPNKTFHHPVLDDWFTNRQMMQTREMRFSPQLREKLSLYTGGLIKQGEYKPRGTGGHFYCHLGPAPLRIKPT